MTAEPTSLFTSVMGLPLPALQPPRLLALRSLGPHILVILNYCLNESLIHHPSTFCTSPLIQLPTAPSPTFPCSPPEAFSPFRGPSSNSCLTEDPLTISEEAAILHNHRGRRRSCAFPALKSHPQIIIPSASWKNSCSFKAHAIWLLQFLHSTKIY